MNLHEKTSASPIQKNYDGKDNIRRKVVIVTDLVPQLQSKKKSMVSQKLSGITGSIKPTNVGTVKFNF